MKKIIFCCIVFFLCGIPTIFALNSPIEEKIHTLVQKLSIEKSKKLTGILENKIQALEQKSDDLSLLRLEIYSFILGEIQTKILLSEGIKSIFEDISNGYIQKKEGSVPKVSIIVYDDLQCPFCALLHNSNTLQKLQETYRDDIQIIFQHFPLEFHKDAFPAAALLECIGAKKGSIGFYNAIDAIFTSKDPSAENIINIGVELGVKKEDLDVTSCTKQFATKIQNQQNIGSKVFQIQGTPSSVIVNNSTYQYSVVSGAVGYETFQETLENILQTKKESN